MKSMTKKRWYLDTRAEYLAIIHLSRRDDLVITKQPEADNYGFDILVSICNNKRPTGRVFGIQLKAVMSLKPFFEDQRANEIQLNLTTFKPKDIPFPLYLFVFTMENDDGYYQRINQAFRHRQNNLFKTLTREELDNIVEEVNLWYDEQPVFGGRGAGES
jgi:hypothetical protein